MTGFLFGTGDIIAQTFFPENPKSKYDYARTARGIIYGSCIFSFIGSKWYTFLSKINLPQTSSSPLINKTKNAVARMAVDQLMFSPVGIPLYFSVMSIMEGQSFQDLKSKLEQNWWSTLKVNWMVWPAFQLFNLGFVPVQHQLLVVNGVSILWNTFLSLRNAKKEEQGKQDEKMPVHYPPVPE
ncbi:Protein SYM1 [Cyberlindnera fabianii]|nr:Protein SYM1 [Cyberlindnera fabianii]